MYGQPVQFFYVLISYALDLALTWLDMKG
jgi:hypothetical protein